MIKALRKKISQQGKKVFTPDKKGFSSGKKTSSSSSINHIRNSGVVYTDIGAMGFNPASGYRRPRSPPRNYRWGEVKDLLNTVRPIQYSALGNGFKVAVEHIPDLEFVTIGIWIDAGSRFETVENNGVAHFLEHMNFKGTKKYSKSDIDTLFESLGAHFNAYTSRDRTAYYVKVFNKHVDLVIDLVSDILKNGIYAPRYIEMERSTILSEMREVEEIVEEVTMDGMHQVAYDCSSSGLPLTILGPTDNIAKHINREMIVDYIKTHYTGPRMTMVCCGGLSLNEVHKLAERHFSDLPSESHRPPLNARYVGGSSILWNRVMGATHTHIAFPVCGAAEKDATTLQLLQNLFGTYRREMHQQFHMQGANRTRPFIPELECAKFFYTPYEETGLMGFQLVSVATPLQLPPGDEDATGDGGGGGENDGMSDVPGTGSGAAAMAMACDHLLTSLKGLMDKPPTAEALEGAKATYKASIMIPLDSTTNSAEDLGRQMIHFGRRVTLQEHFETVDQITPNAFSDTLARYFDWTKIRPTISSAGPPETLPLFDALRNVMTRHGASV